MTQVSTSLTARSAFLQLMALWGMAVAQPLYDILGQNPEFFVVRRSSALELTLLTLTLSFFIPLVLVAMMLLVRRVFPRIAAFYWACVFFILQSALAVLLLKAAGVVGWKRLVLASVVLSLIGCLLYVRSRTYRTYLTALAAAGLLFPLYFLGAPAMRGLLWDAESGSISVTESANPAPVVMVVFDELPLSSLLKASGEIDAEHFPNFAELAKRSNWFQNTWSVSTDTTTAVPAILTGTIPQRGSLPRFQDQPHNIFVLLSSQFAMRVHESITSLCPSQICSQKPKNVLSRARTLISDMAVIYAHRLVPIYFNGRLPAINLSWGNFTQEIEKGEEVDHDIAAQPVELFGEFVKSFEDFSHGSDPSFTFLHVLLPHPPWRYFPSGRSYSSPSGSIQIGGFSTDDVWKDDEQSVAQAYLRHMLQLQYTDSLLGKLMRELHTRNLFDRSLLVVVADHGASFRPAQNRRAPTETNLVDVLQVPLFIKLPDQKEGAVSSTLAQTVDVLPTIADVLGMRVPWPVEGRSLLHKYDVDRSEIRYLAPDKSILYRNLEDLNPQEALQHRTRLVDTYFSQISTVWNHTPALPVARSQDPNGASCMAWIEAPEAFSAVSLDSTKLPALLRGQVECVRVPRGSHDVVVALNGSYAGKKRIDFTDQAAQKFSMLLDEALFKAGSNELTIHVETEGGRLRIPASLNANAPLLLARNESGQESLKVPGNKEIALSTGQIRGFLDIAKFGVEGAALEGWALDAVKRQRVEQVAVFCDDRLLTTVRTLVRRPDVAAAFGGEDVALSGFQVAISLDSCGGSGMHHLRLFGIGTDQASELSYGEALADLKEVKFGA